MILGLEMIFFFFSFFRNSTKGMLFEKKKKKLEFIKILKFCSVKDPVKKMRR